MRLLNNASFIKDVKATFGQGYTHFTSLWDVVRGNPSVDTKKACEAIVARHTHLEEAPSKSLLGRVVLVSLVAAYIGYSNFSQISAIASKMLSL